MNPTDLRLLAVLLQKPYTVTALAKLIKKEYMYIHQRLMVLRNQGLIVGHGFINYRNRQKVYVVPNSMKREVHDLISKATTSEGRYIKL